MNMSFMLTVGQMESGQKSETRRLGWKTAKVGQIVTPIEKGQGLQRGEKVKPLGCGPIRFTQVRQERLIEIDQAGVDREGFPDMNPQRFIRMFCQHNGCTADTVVTVIQFERVIPSGSVREGQLNGEEK
jgi:hypothetical protein